MGSVRCDHTDLFWWNIFKSSLNKVNDKTCFSLVGPGVVDDIDRTTDIVAFNRWRVSKRGDDAAGSERPIVELAVGKVGNVGVHPILGLQLEANTFIDATVGVEVFKQ
ncbi:hypothetical protein SAMN06266787_1197 [Halorubrum ezzemoulense]|uniref:Uncharacterized protein n=1 Tax=Halorubrum ezzemoulense TaxID=337243 RepID=A0A238YTY8_HALEZ|nr:hypothetical protein SAMN06266787_1197 [Halorubrum ezzemoulense]